MLRKLYLAFEFIALFAGVPAALVVFMPGAFVLPFLWAGALICWLALRMDPSFDRACLWRIPGRHPALKIILLRFALALLGMTAIVLIFMPDNFLNLVRTKPLLWMMVMILYPVLSVLPQGIIYRAFLFHRYRKLASGRSLLVLGAFAFSVAHLPFGNAWALGLTLIGGLLFGSTYLKSRSVLLSSIEHALYGCLIFTIGLGAYFFHGTMRAAHMAAH